MLDVKVTRSLIGLIQNLQQRVTACLPNRDKHKMHMRKVYIEKEILPFNAMNNINLDIYFIINTSPWFYIKKYILLVYNGNMQ